MQQKVLHDKSNERKMFKKGEKVYARSFSTGSYRSKVVSSSN